MWFSKSIQQTLEELHADKDKGLDENEAASRLQQYGHNRLTAKKRKSALALFISQLKDTLIYVLFGAVVITFAMGEYIDGVIILLVIIVNAVLGVIQEVKAGNAIDALKDLSAPKALVKRNGTVSEIESEKIVQGDILVLEAGRFVAADVRLLESANLQIEESALTGESVPSEKNAEADLQDGNIPLGDQVNMAFMSTVVTYGRGLGVVVETGMKTEVGKIADIINQEKEDKTPLEKRLDELGKTLGKVAIGICIVMFALAWIQGRDLADNFLTAVSLAVASIPEGLAAIVAVVLSIGVTRMARKKAIIKKLPAVETLGSVTVVCSDKTGTLTQNKMTVVSYYDLTGEEVELKEENEQPSEAALLLAKAMILCSDATYENGKGTGDPTEIALLRFGDQLKIDRKKLSETIKRKDELPFDSDRKLMSTIQEEDGKLTAYTKGAIDNLIACCSRILHNGEAIPLTEEHTAQFKKATEKMSANALRTLASAYKPLDGKIDHSEIEKDLILIGMVGMIDPPRPEVKESISQAKQAGITTVMITGDHKDTAFAIAEDLGIAEKKEQAITGSELKRHAGEENDHGLTNYRVFARVSPEHKVKIVRAFKSDGHIVAMTGDGVNDAPSLNTADIGVAMGVTGTDVARNAAHMILADDNFATIIAAIEQGRNIYNNIKKSVIFLLASNVGEVIAMVVAILIGMPAPLMATQLLWINLLTDTLPAIALGMDPGDPDVMKQAPRSPGESFFAHGATQRIIIGGVAIGLFTIVAFWFGYYEHGFSPYDDNIPENIHEYARTMAFMTIICCQLFYSFTFRHPTKSIFRTGFFSNKYLTGAVALGLALQLLVMGLPFMQQAFRLQMLDLQGWIYALGLGIIPVLLSEILKFFKRRSGRRPS
jgi:P-type Ca2+ transporter type 2C